MAGSVLRNFICAVVIPLTLRRTHPTVNREQRGFAREEYFLRFQAKYPLLAHPQYKSPVKPEDAEKWLDLTRDFTEATRAEPGNKWFEWSRSVEDPNEFVLVEAFEDDGAAAHVNSAHFAQAMTDMRPALRATPKIVSRQIDGDGWDAMGELTID